MYELRTVCMISFSVKKKYVLKVHSFLLIETVTCECDLCSPLDTHLAVTHLTNKRVYSVIRYQRRG